MRYQQIVRIAKGMGIKSHRKKKVDLIRQIQDAEKNLACYATTRVEHCGEIGCLWREDCLEANKDSGQVSR